MIIGINAAAAIKQPRTGVEEYTYQLIKHLTMLPEARAHRFLLYVPSVALAKEGLPVFDFTLPPNFEIKILHWPLPFLWTQIRLAWEMFVRSPETLFIPVHILPFFARLDLLSRRGWAPKNSVVTIHGLEYEYWPQGYSFWQRFYLRWNTKSAAMKAQKIIAISENTKQDLVKLYGVKADKITVVHHGIEAQSSELRALSQNSKPYILCIGRIETKKNVQGILEAYKILKGKYKIPHKLILVGTPGYGYEKIKLQIRGLLEIRNLDLDIKEVGYISNNEKQRLLAGADIFLFPSFYEGFGLPVLEAQVAGVPIVTSLGSCLPEIAGQGALFVNPHNSVEIVQAVKRLIDDKVLRDRLRQSGFENIKRFSWEKCARETLKIIIATFLATEK